MRSSDRRIVACGVLLLGVQAFGLGAAAQDYEPPGAPRMPAGGRGATAAPPSTTGAPSNPATMAPGDLAAAAKAGDANAQLRYGLTFFQAKPPNVTEAINWWRQASDRGNSAAPYNIGQLYYNGSGVLKNPVEAVKWYRIAADRGYANGQAQLGWLYERGEGVPQDYAEAVKWYRAAADQNNAAGQNNLAGMYATGRGVAADPVEAVRLYKLSAAQGNPVAQSNLGLQYLAGKGIAQNDSAAYFWLNLAAAKMPATLTAQRDLAVRMRDVVARKLAAPEVERLQQLAVAWTPGSTNVPTDAPAPPGAAATAPSPGGIAGMVGSGTGFVITTGGHVVTNNHVVATCGEVRARRNGEELGVLKVIAKDAQNDLALLKLSQRFGDVAVFREDRGVRQGDSIVVFGFPLGPVLSGQGNLTTGTVSALSGVANDSRMLQVSAPIQPGNSGGPVLDSSGSVIGVMSKTLNTLQAAVLMGGTVPQNLNFAIKSSVVRNFLDTNGVEYRTSGESRELKTADIGDRAKKFTLLIECLH